MMAFNRRPSGRRELIFSFIPLRRAISTLQAMAFLLGDSAASILHGAA
jgi:hypothetical protein